jgi:membrane protein DedA with SNARE-associated domain
MGEWLDWLGEVWLQLHDGMLLPELGIWGYVALGILVATEGPLSTLLGAAAAAAGLLDVRGVLLATVLGNVIGDCVWYSAGYLGGMRTVERYGRIFGLHRGILYRLEAQVHSHAIKMIVLAKIAYGLIIPTLVATGLARVPWRRWFPVVFVVETLWSVLLVFVGYRAAGFVAELERGLRFIGIGALVLVIVLLGLFLHRRQRAAQEKVLSQIVMQAEWQAERHRMPPVTYEPEIRINSAYRMRPDQRIEHDSITGIEPEFQSDYRRSTIEQIL